SRRGSAHTSAAQSGPAHSRTAAADPRQYHPAVADTWNTTQAPPNRALPFRQAQQPVSSAPAQALPKSASSSSPPVPVHDRHGRVLSRRITQPLQLNPSPSASTLRREEITHRRKNSLKQLTTEFPGQQTPTHSLRHIHSGSPVRRLVILRLAALTQRAEPVLRDLVPVFLHRRDIRLGASGAANDIRAVGGIPTATLVRALWNRTRHGGSPPQSD